jgi:hypothetical protein
MYIFNMYTVHLRGYMCQGVQYSHALSVENRPPDHPFSRAEAASARGYPRLVVTQSRGLPRSRAQCNLPLFFRSLGTGSGVSKRSCPANGIGAEEGSGWARAGYCNPRDVSCLYKVRKRQPSPLRRDDESPSTEARCNPAPKLMDVHSRTGATSFGLGPSCGGVCRALGVPPWRRRVRGRSSVRREQTCKRP